MAYYWLTGGKIVACDTKSVGCLRVNQLPDSRQYRLTKTAVEGLAPGPSDRVFWDQALKGFGVKVTPAGSRVYLVQYRRKGARQTRRYTIGRHGAPWTTEKAREAAAVLLARVRLGEDPFKVEKARARHEQSVEKAAIVEAVRARAELYPAVVADFIGKYAKRRNKTWPEAKRMLMSRDLADWSSRQVREIKRRDVLAIVDNVSERSESTARVLFAHLRRFFAWCAERELVDQSPCLGLRGPPPSKPRDRWLSDAEIAKVWLGCDQLGYPFGPLFQLLLLTAQRREEVTSMRWDEIDWAAMEWVIPAERAKNSRAHTVDLAPVAMALLSPLREARGAEGLVFTTTGGTPVSGHAKAKLRLDRLLGDEAASVASMKPWRVHDLRRTAATGMARLGNPPHIVEAVLNHVSGARGGLVAVYQHYDHRAERRAASLQWAEHVARLVGLDSA